MLKKMTVLAMALGALVAFAVPASASAFWTDEHKAIQQNVQMALTGNIEFKATAGGFVQGGIKCQITSKMQLFVGQTTGQMDTFEPDSDNAGTATNRCIGNGGFAFCQTHNLQPTELPWTVHTNQTGTPDIQVTANTIHLQTTGGFCPAKFVAITPATLTGTPDNVETTNTLALHGHTTVHLGQTSPPQTQLPSELVGHLLVEDPDENTCGV